ncbi:MAG: hypothetical protein ACREEV_17200 [Dongiaceae bacterium]
MQAQQPPDDRSQLLRELFDRTMHDAGDLRIVRVQQLVELLLADLFGGGVAERIAAHAAQSVAPIVQDVDESTPTRAVADKAVGLPQLGVIGIDLHSRQDRAAMFEKRGSRRRGRIGHGMGRRILARSLLSRSARICSSRTAEPREGDRQLHIVSVT